jgi:hypothetical protein
LLGGDIRILHQTNRRVTITGIDNHQIGDLPIGTGAGYGLTHEVPVIFIMNQYACLGHGKTIHASGPLESFKLIVDDKSKLVGGKQRISTPDGFFIPLDILNGLPYFKVQHPTDEEMENLPHVVLTSDIDWDPTILNNIADKDTLEWYPDNDESLDYGNHNFNKFGQCSKRVLNQCQSLYNYVPESRDLEDVIENVINCRYNNTSTTTSDIDYEALRPRFGLIPIDIIKWKFKVTTQYACTLTLCNDMRKQYKSRFPTFNVTRRNETVAAGTIYLDYAAVNDGSKCAQIFVGCYSLLTDVYGMKTDKEFIYTLEDNVRRHGAMSKLISSNALAEIGTKVKDILQALFIDD